VDNTPPVSAITAPLAGEFVGGTEYTVTGTADDGAGSGVQGVEVSTDGGVTWNPASGTDTWSYTWTLPADGAYNIISRASDLTSNTESPGSGVTVTVDRTPPSSTVTYPSDGELFGGSSVCTITGTADDATGSGVSSVEVSTDGGLTWNAAAGTGTWSYSWTITSDGTFTVRSRAADVAGNVETPAAGVTVTVDATPPASSVTAPAAGELVGGTQYYTVTGTADDGSGSGVATVEVSTDGGGTWDNATGTSAWSYTWTLPVDGVYTIMSRATDVAGNTETPGPGVTVTVDTTPPAGSIELKSGRFTKARTVQLTLSARDAGSNCPEPDPVMCGIDMMQLSDDGVTWQAWETPNTAVSWHFPKGDGEKSVFVHYRDPAGNVSEDYVATAILDTVNPTSAVSDPADGATIITAGYTIIGTASDGGSGVELVEVSTDGGSSWDLATGTTDWTYPWTPASDGSYTIVSRATDSAGNVENPGQGVTVTVSVDTDPPTGSISINGGSAFTNSTSVTLTLGAADTGSGVADMRICSDGTFDTEPWEPFAANRGWTLNSGEGLKEVRVIYRDAAGNASTAYTAEITLDVTPPAGTVVIDGGADITHTVTVTLTLSATDSLSGVSQMQISEDGLFLTEPWEPYSTTRTWDLSSSEGVKSVYVRFMDAASNVSASAADNINLNFDADPPVSAITTPADGGSVSGVASTITGTASDGSGDGVATVEVSTNGGVTWAFADYSSGNWSYTWNVGSAGAHNILSRATDNASNIETPGAGVSVTVDALGTPDLPHTGWDAWLAGGNCAFCHLAPATFLSSGFREEPGYCSSCHNATAPAHERNLTGTREHSVLVNVTGGNSKMPIFGGMSSHLMYGVKVVCVTCHDPMQKDGDMGRVWEYTTTSDDTTYTLQNGGWAGSGDVTPVVYRDTSLWAGPAMAKDRKPYVVAPSEYSYDERSGTVSFASAQDPGTYVYVTLEYPYLRVSNAANTLCADCHTEATHMGENCLACHSAHNTDNLGGIRETVRATDMTELPVAFTNTTGTGSFGDGDTAYDGICEVCHTQTLFHKRDGSGASHHEGEDCTTCHVHSAGFRK